MPVDQPRSDPNAEQPFRIYTANSFGQAIRKYRTDAGLTQRQLADAAGLDQAYISRLENGLDNEHLQRLLNILQRLGVRVTLSRADW
jgi:transcriptional regulator with XRE-family HTH domain